MDIRNLNNAKTTLMSKINFTLLNGDKKYWVDIWPLNYGNFNIWEINLVPNSSIFHKTLRKSAKLIRAQLGINACNPNITDFWENRWFIDIPLALKPTHTNMHMDPDSINVSDLVCNDSIFLDSIHKRKKARYNKD